MGASTLSSRAIIGEFYGTLETHLAGHWVSDLSFAVESDQASQTHAWILAAPAMMREWIAGRQAAGFWEEGVTVINRKFEGSIEVLVDEIRRDKTGQVLLRTRDLATRSTILWAQLISELIDSGESGVGYAGEVFFSTAHTRNVSNAVPQSNLLSYNIAAPTAPTGTEIAEAVSIARAAIMAFEDHEREPLNLDAYHFYVFVPKPLIHLIRMEPLAALSGGGYTVSVIPNPWLTWTDALAVFRADGRAKPFIRQQEFTRFASVGAGSELAFNDQKQHFGVSSSRNAGYGLWEHACKVRFI
jgi:phage major head subunit gpT-like protein